MADLHRNAQILKKDLSGGDRIDYEEFYPWRSKVLIDEIDRVLAEHYGFTDEELDFIVNYDIKYRMAANAENGDD